MRVQFYCVTEEKGHNRHLGAVRSGYTMILDDYKRMRRGCVERRLRNICSVYSFENKYAHIMCIDNDA